MDFKHKGITWVGNVYQKFEAVCQEVDHIINQDTVKYVENQVNSASENVKKFYSDVVQGLLPPTGDSVKYEAKTVAPRGRVPTNAYSKSPSHKEGKAANSVVNISSVGHDSTNQLDKRSQVSCKVTFVNQEAAQVPSHSLQEKNADVPLGKNDDVLLDKGLDENMKEYAVNELLSEKNDGTLTDKHAFTEPDAGDPLSNPLNNVTSEINHANKRASLVCDDSNLQLEDDALLGNSDGVLIDKNTNQSSEEDTTMEFNTSDPLKHQPNCASCQVKVTNEEAISGWDNSDLPLESFRLSRKNDDDLSDEDSDECSKKVVIMEPDASDCLNDNHPSHVWSGTNFISKEATLVCDDSNLLSKSEVFSGKIDNPLTDKDFDKSPVKLESKLLSGKNDDALTNKYSNESLKEDTVLELEHYASYPLKNQPGCTSSTINYKNEEVSSVSNDSSLKLECEIVCGKNSDSLIDKEPDASCKEQANLELTTELISHWNKESIKEILWSCYNECEEDIVTSTVDPPETLIHGANVESTHKVGQASGILVNNLVNFSPQMETTSDYFENGTCYSSNASDVTSSELVSLVLSCGKTVETAPVSSSKSLLEGSFSASRSSVKNFSSSTIVHDKPSDHCVSVDCETRPSYENKAFEMKLASFRNSSLSMPSLGTHASRASESASLPKFCTSNHVEFSASTSSGALNFFTELGCPFNLSGYIPDAEMETVDLGHKVSLKDECDIVDCKALHAVSRRTQKLRSYKKRIQDAFTSKKRLAKEYERLAIWYGDIDLELSTDSSQKLETKTGSTSYASDSEWELL